jgi:hypothetical protein
MKLTPQQALEEARKRYPKGTIYKCASENYLIFDVESVEDFSIYRDQICAEEFKGVLYDLQTDTWAKIIKSPKSLEDRLVDEFGFVKWAFPVKWTFLHGKFTTNRYEKDGLSIDFDYENGEVVSIDAKIETPLISDPNPNNLEDFIKAYLRLF